MPAIIPCLIARRICSHRARIIHGAFLPGVRDHHQINADWGIFNTYVGQVRFKQQITGARSVADSSSRGSSGTKGPSAARMICWPRSSIESTAQIRFLPPVGPGAALIAVSGAGDRHARRRPLAWLRDAWSGSCSDSAVLHRLNES